MLAILKNANQKLRALPNQQTTKEIMTKLAGELLLQRISESEFKESLMDILYQRERADCLELAKAEVARMLTTEEDAESRRLIAERQAEYLAAEPERITQREAERVAKSEKWQAQQRH